MEAGFLEIVDESINLELNASRLYTLFHETFPEHAGLWWGLVVEEKNHAALLRSIKECFAPAEIFPAELLASSLQVIQKNNAELLRLIKQFEKVPPTVEESFRVALELEQSAGEAHYQQFMGRQVESRIDLIFQKLNKEDKNHAERLLAYMKNKGISVE